MRQQLELARRVMETTTAVRTHNGRANSAIGVTDLLTETEGVKRRMGLLRGLVAAAMTGTHEAELSEAMWNAEGLRVSRPSVAVQALSSAEVEQLDAELRQTQREFFALSDRIAECNVAKITLELPADLAAQVTG